jgi:myosin protein heavy chain
MFSSAKFQISLLDVERLTKRTEQDSTFHVFYYLWEGVDEQTRQRLHLDTIDRPFFNLLSTAEDREGARICWINLLKALEQLQLNVKQIEGITNVLAVICHLLYAGATTNIASRSSFVRIQNATYAAELLGLTFDQLSVAVFRGNQQQPEMSSRFTMTNRTGVEALESFVHCLYNELFASITNLINRALNPQQHSPALTISLFDVPGSNFFSSAKSGATQGLNDLIYNYVNERLSELFYKQSFVAPAELYAREQVNVTVEKPLTTPERCTRLLDLKQQLVSN